MNQCEDIIKRMKIQLSELRRIIRDVIVEQGWVPGRWHPESAEPVDDEEIHSIEHGGMGKKDADEDSDL